ncbi:hypothetical protein H2200_004437 [Cladophialophora chaetospira]|uniref:Uncharacterized protein n=1 Tax=Cladophialophora chaetospira TaxID=386627 RepID=A0AA39CKF9_9EURO|nr:hypothetical protein H2200_004437 [Cladophialophora chaetospira]
MKSSDASINSFASASYLDKVKSLQEAYPALIQLVDKIAQFDDHQSRTVKSTYSNEYDVSPGRCAVLEFKAGGVHHEDLPLASDLRHYFKTHETSVLNADACRLFILEDLEAEFIELLGDKLGVDPLVFAEQTNAWYFTDIVSVGHRQLPSLIKPQKSFTLRYHEIRKPLSEHKKELSAMTVLLVDPPMEISRAKVQGKAVAAPNYIFKAQNFKNRGELWMSEEQHSQNPLQLVKTLHASEPYHKGSMTLYPLSFRSTERLQTAGVIADEDQRDLTSPFDETIFYWKNLVTSEDIESVQAQSVNSATHLLKFVAYHWTNALELVSHTLAQSEYFSDDNPATRPRHMNTNEWRREFFKVVNANDKINYFRRKMINFEGNVELNLERLGTALDGDVQTGQLPRAILDAQKDFKAIASRLRPLRERANTLSTVANDIASVRAAFQAIEDSASGLSLSILATVIFPFTLVASMLSMPDPYKPSGSQFWIFFAVSIPLTAVIILFLVVNQNREHWHDRVVKAVHLITQRKDNRTRRKDPVKSTSMA